MSKRLTAMASLLLASGCVNMAPEHERPALSVPSSYLPADRPEGTAVASEIDWSDYFRDDRLKALIKTALVNNRDLMVATAQVEQARAQFRIQDSNRYPNVDASASGTRTRTPLDTINTGQQIPGSGDGGGGDAPNSITYNRYDVGVGITSFELDFWGRLANLSEAARADYLSTVAAQRAFYLSLIGDVASTYYQLIESQEQLALAEATAQSRREGLEIARKRLDAGVTSALPYRQAEGLLTTAEQQVAAERLSSAQLRNQLQVLVGGTIPEDMPEGQKLAEQAPTIYLDAGLPSDLMLVRPDIISAEETLRAARANIGAARAAFFPSISLTGSAGFASSELDGLFKGDSFTWSAGPSINLPIFDWGAREADLGLAKARETEAVANYDKTVQTAFREVSDALAGRRWLAQQVLSLEENVEAQEQIAHIARLRYREGVADYLEVLDAERSLFSARQTLLTTRRSLYQNAATLFIALGGGAPPADSE
ncbi:efflux transporter outer membrane subunit [Altericroceibacterium spongiae]|uniref:Efflux transporter outer membrane subunit n=1 Tax=Altericroceibacterium spongiae TaxID=2320269 RepID=A0A420ERQ9_9SPHN|nr:efflux transporter outer membrane subunit [Altericroceibacterium spongiae]RKF23320.1 efflux transporter outer membrane subunit [Altericroceibacterium spongiae]